jgi:hypothetical protein
MDEQSVGYVLSSMRDRAQITRTFGWIQRRFNFGSRFWTSTDTTTNTSSQTECVVLIATIVYRYIQSMDEVWFPSEYEYRTKTQQNKKLPTFLNQRTMQWQIMPSPRTSQQKRHHWS